MHKNMMSITREMNTTFTIKRMLREQAHPQFATDHSHDWAVTTFACWNTEILYVCKHDTTKTGVQFNVAKVLSVKEFRL